MKLDEGFDVETKNNYLSERDFEPQNSLEQHIEENIYKRINPKSDNNTLVIPHEYLIASNKDVLSL